MTLTKDYRNESIFSTYIPTVISNHLWDDHYKIYLPEPTRSIAAISSNNREIYVFTQKGTFLIYDLELVRAGNSDTPSFKKDLSENNCSLSDSISDFKQS